MYCSNTNQHAHESKLLLVHCQLNLVHLALNTAECSQQFILTSNMMWYFFSVIAVHSSQMMLEVHFSNNIIHSPPPFWGLHLTSCVIIVATTTVYLLLKWYSVTPDILDYTTLPCIKCAIFWVFPRRLVYIGRRFGTYPFHL
jgi:hypothetical protein